MSKSLGNIIDPLDMAEKYGADATRISLIIGTGPGNDLKLSEDRIKGYKHFGNKIWNATRFVVGETDGYTPGTSPLNATDTETYEHFMKEMKDVTDDIEYFRYYLAGEKLYQYFWYTFADKIIEETKTRIRTGSPEDKSSAQELLIRLLLVQIAILHPFMPFVTESLWHVIPSAWRKDDHRPLALTPWPM